MLPVLLCCFLHIVSPCSSVMPVLSMPLERRHRMLASGESRNLIIHVGITRSHPPPYLFTTAKQVYPS